MKEQQERENSGSRSGENRRKFLQDLHMGLTGDLLFGTQLSCSDRKNSLPGRNAAGSGMAYRRLGRTGLLVSEIGLGGHYDGPGWKEKNANQQAQRESVFRECLKSGVNFFDTNTEEERQSFGNVLRSVPTDRDKIYIVTDINDKKEMGPEIHDHLMEMIDVQLANLQLPNADILRFTTVINNTPSERLEAAIKAFKRMKKQGKVKYLAVSQHDPDLLSAWIDRYDEIDIIYVPYNYFAHRAEESLFDAAIKKDMGIVIIKPFNKGVLFDPRLAETMTGSGSRSIIEMSEKEKGNRKPEDLTEGTGLTLAQASLRYILSNKKVSTVIPGMETVSEVVEDLKAAGTQLSSLDLRSWSAVQQTVTLLSLCPGTIDG